MKVCSIMAKEHIVVVMVMVMMNDVDDDGGGDEFLMHINQSDGESYLPFHRRLCERHTITRRLGKVWR